MTSISTNQSIKEKIKTFQNQFTLLLDEYYQSYILYHTNPDIPEYEKRFQQDKGALHTLNKQLFVLTNEMEQKNEKINKQMKQMNHLLQKEKKIYQTLSSQYEQLNGSGNSSQIMIENATENYKKQYISNLDLKIGLHVLIATIFGILYHSSTSPSSSTFTFTSTSLQQRI